LQKQLDLLQAALGIDTDDENHDSLIWWPSWGPNAVKHYETNMDGPERCYNSLAAYVCSGLVISWPKL
jgi:hypothetical protein